MGKATGFIEFPREAAPYRPPEERLLDFNEIYVGHDTQQVAASQVWVDNLLDKLENKHYDFKTKLTNTSLKPGAQHCTRISPANQVFVQVKWAPSS